MEQRVVQTQDQTNATPVLACNASRVTPGAISITFRPAGVTSITARSVMMRSTTPTPVRGSVLKSSPNFNDDPLALQRAMRHEWD